MNMPETTAAPAIPLAPDSAGAPAELIACPVCDLLQRQVDPPINGRLTCARCGTVLMTNRMDGFQRTLASSIASVILMTAAISLPFLELSIAGRTSTASVLQVAFAFRGTMIAPLSVAILLLIVVIPLIRAIALTYTLMPLILGRPPAPRAEPAFRLARELKPWAMSEIFVIGVVVALVKIAGMASVTLGPAFWAMTLLVVLVIYEGTSLNEWAVWRALERARAAR